MNTWENYNKEISVRNLFKDDIYKIPIYQRNYSWGVDEVEQLLHDIYNYSKVLSPDGLHQSYFIGNLIVLHHDCESPYFETIDGQQRLTTLYILLSALKNYSELECTGLNYSEWFNEHGLSFDNREKSVKALKGVYNGNIDYQTEGIVDSQIKLIYSKVKGSIQSICSDGSSGISSFVSYFLDNVKILRVAIPEVGVDRNHFFEVLNSRGVQLEQHEIVKADLMKNIKDEPYATKTFDIIWSACSKMEKYVQMGFTDIDFRNEIFGDKWMDEPWRKKESYESRFARYVNYVNNSSVSNVENCSLAKTLLEFEKGRRFDLPVNGIEDEQEGQFYSVINFSNFLMHVLKILCPELKEIALEDTKLSYYFTLAINQSKNKAHFSKKFLLCLLDMKYLFDRYVIKRYNEEWIIKQFKTEYYRGNLKPTYGTNTIRTQNISNKIIHLQSMYHVSNPRMIYKNWLQAVLAYIWKYKSLDEAAFCDYLEYLAKVFMLNNYLSDKKVELLDIIYQNGNFIERPQLDLWNEESSMRHLNNGTSVERFIFNYYDYLLWRDNQNVGFEFTYRNSVEHFYPQHPEFPNKTLEEKYGKNGKTYLHSFGNLCLITPSQNSSFSNDMPVIKYNRFNERRDVAKLSLKLNRMFSVVKINLDKKIKSTDVWLQKQICDEEKIAIDRLRKELATE